jgi:hypothetical protein
MFEKLIVAHVIEKSTAFHLSRMFMYPQEVATQVRSEQDESSPLPSNIFPSNNGYHRPPIYPYAYVLKL